MSRKDTSQESGSRTYYVPRRSVVQEVNRIAGHDYDSDLEIANVVEKELKTTDEYIRGKT